MSRDPAPLAALLDTPPEEAFDRLTRLASRSLTVPMAVIAFSAGDRQFLKSCLGLPEPWASRREAPLGFSFGEAAAAPGEPLVVEDARQDPRLKDHPAVEDWGVGACLAAPLMAP